MNHRFVEAFYWVVTLKSVSRAAEKLFITQSAMSSRIAALEEELGVLLLDRRDKQFRLTVGGLRFFTHAQRLLALHRDIKAEMGAGAGGAQRTVSLRIGVIESVLHSWLIDWVQHMRRTNPDFALELTVETTPVLVDQVQRGALDLAFAALPTSGENLRSRALPPMEMVFVGHKDLHRKRRYTLADLAQLELLTFQRGSQPHVALLDLFREAGLEPRRVHAISSISAMVQLVEGGIGVATLPLAAVLRLGERLPIKPLACEMPLLPLPVHASWRDDPTSSVAIDVLDAVFDYIGVPKTGAKAPRRRTKTG
ncbi:MULTISPECIES: LysR family transcriptional regulator [unclassified Rhizobacter]|uniref:LysR family transcriptional regulator n=1 Tax=unclassified Rhizobacter TaxID=2640088 RepID=UPI000701E5D8|nr:MULTISPECIES: LysR family transcriptional regulator [unclassified Rhizobacter]KQU74645.1 LysR family transcriptional regulator [Rhizobacter sp. Root29]KQW13522.1 LysR family transcriptional regulator [Rhizobacter sp. Root1238]KRB23131.1 LysR family transcriptional regulator [Rhizobacter sp. Root16D2]